MIDSYVCGVEVVTVASQERERLCARGRGIHAVVLVEVEIEGVKGTF